MRPRLPFTLPLLVALLFGLAVQLGLGLDQPLGDDWELYLGLDDRSLAEALFLKSTPEEGYRFRPVVNGLVWFERLLLEFPAQRLLHVAWIGLCGSALARLLSALSVPPGRAALAATFFVLHPGVVEMYGWASTRIDAMATCFSLFALDAALRRRYLEAALLFVLACGSKESAYPVCVVAPVLPWLLGRGWRECLAWAVASWIPVVVFVGFKVVALGGWVPEAATVAIPLGARVEGLATYARPLLLWPSSEAVAFWPLTAAFVALLIAALALGPLLRRRRREAAPLSQRGGLGLLVLFAAALAVTGGVPVRDDFAGGRLWFLPSAFLFGWLASVAFVPVLRVAIACGAVLLVLELVPYGEASEAMRSFRSDMRSAMAEHGHAIRVRNLPEYSGPVPLFALMNFVYMRQNGGADPEDRPLLSLDQGPREQVDAAYQDARWRAYWRERGKRVLDLRMDPETMRLTREE